MGFGDHLRKRLEGVIPVSSELAGVLERHYRLMLAWNRRMNLTRITAMEEAVERHYAESLFLAASMASGSIIDVGSGAGFPGIPVAAFHPSADVTLVESDQRKAAFLREASDLLPNLRVASIRFAEVEGQIDWVIARAVRLADVLPTALRVASRVGLLVGSAERQELLMHDQLRGVRALPLPWGEARWLVTAEVSRET